MTGLHGRLLDVDLTHDRIGAFEVPEDWQRRFVGGRGLGVRVLLEEQPAGVDPLGPENTLVFVTGPLTGTGVPGAARHWVGARSPLTGSLGESYSGGTFGRRLARTGFDGIVVRGRADAPTRLTIEDGTARLDDATDIWGTTVSECENKLVDGDGSCASIGPAGENWVHLAGIINDGNHAAGGRGLGAVMGSKRLKAVVVRGNERPPIDDERDFERRRRAFADSLRSNDQLMRWGRFGTSSAVEILNEQDMLPTAHFRRGQFEDADSIGAFALRRMVISREGCGSCPVKCKGVVSGSFGEETIESGGPEYETIAAFGSLVLNDDIAAIALANQYCNEYGLNTIGVGHAIAAAMEGETRFEWGDADAILELVDRIAHRDGIGDVLADGLEATERYLDLPDGTVHVKGSPVGMHDVTKKRGMGVSAAVSPRGATHMEGFDDSVTGGEDRPTDLSVETNDEGHGGDPSPRTIVSFENARSFVNSLVVCSHVVQVVGNDRNYADLRELLAAATGREYTIEDTLTIGERNYTLGKLFALREGFDMEDDGLPNRLRTASGSDGDESTGGDSDADFEQLRRRYYDERGWTDDGIEPATLRELGIEGLARRVT